MGNVEKRTDCLDGFVTKVSQFLSVNIVAGGCGGSKIFIWFRRLDMVSVALSFSINIAF